MIELLTTFPGTKGRLKEAEEMIELESLIIRFVSLFLTKVMPFKTVQNNGTPQNGTVVKVMPFKTVQNNGTPQNGTLVKVMPFKTVQNNGTPVKVMPFWCAVILYRFAF